MSKTIEVESLVFRYHLTEALHRKGIYLSLRIYIVGLPLLCLLGPCIWFWGTFHGMLYIAYSAALVSFYLGFAFFFIEGFPFANPFKPSMGAAMQGTMFAAIILIVIFGVIQWFVFRSASLVFGATVVLTVLALIVAHISLGNMERKARKNLQLLNLSPQKIFREIE